jgi:hypothetical protein
VAGQDTLCIDAALLQSWDDCLELLRVIQTDLRMKTATVRVSTHKGSFLEQTRCWLCSSSSSSRCSAALQDAHQRVHVQTMEQSPIKRVTSWCELKVGQVHNTVYVCHGQPSGCFRYCLSKTCLYDQLQNSMQMNDKE